MFAADADPEVLARGIRRQVADQPRRAGLSEPATALYERILDQGCRYLILVIRQLPAFQPRALAEVLDRLSTMGSQLSEILAHTPRTSLYAPRGTANDEEFRAEYLRYLAARLDRLELLGLSMRHRPRLALSVAYLSLTVSEQDGPVGLARFGPERLAEHWFGQAGERDRASTVPDAFPRLKDLDLRDVEFSDVTPLSCLQLRKLNLSHGREYQGLELLGSAVNIRYLE